MKPHMNGSVLLNYLCKGGYAFARFFLFVYRITPKFWMVFKDSGEPNPDADSGIFINYFLNIVRERERIV